MHEPSVGIFMRTTCGSPAAIREETSSAERFRQWPSYFGGRPAARWAARICSSRSGVQKQRKPWPCIDDLLDIGLVEVLAVALAIGAVGAADVGTFRPFQAAPFQRVKHLRLEFGRRARRIRVFDAQDELAAMLFGEEIVEQRDIGGADMWLAGRGGCDADANA